MATPADPALYDRVKARIYRENPKHSAYRSGALVKAYKAAFADKHGSGKSPYKGKKSRTRGLSRWFRENWRNQRGEVGYRRKGDIYRPTRRVTKDTPTTMGELTDAETARASREKRATGRVRKFGSWMTLSQVLAAVPDAARLGVSEVARGPRGFVSEYRRARTRGAMMRRPVPGYPGQTWGQRREAFVARHLAQYRKNPTERRALALKMWAFDPSKQ